MDSLRSDENTKLKNFLSSLSSGNLLKLIESNQIHFQEKYSSMYAKVKQSEEEITRQYQQLQQNSHLIEKFQNEVQEVSKQNSELLEQQQVLKEENENLNNQLQCSEDKFAQLDIVYDEEVSVLNERVSELLTQVDELTNMQNENNNQFGESQAELYSQLKHNEELNTELSNQLKYLEDQQAIQKNDMKTEIIKANKLNETLTYKINDCEESIKDLQNRLAASLTENKEIIVLKNQIDILNNAQKAEENEYRIEKSRLITVNEDLKMVVDDLKKKLLSKERETEEVYLKFKQLTKPATVSSKFSTRKRSSTDDPKPIDNSSDSDNSSISFYKLRKKRHISTETDDDNLFNGFQNPSNVEIKRKPSILANQTRLSPAPSKVNKKRPYQIHQQHVEIPESPVVSSSALTNMEQK